MESTARISTVSIFLLVLYKAIVIFIYCQSSWKHTCQSSWKHTCQSSWKHTDQSSWKHTCQSSWKHTDQFTTTESYKEVLYDEATEEWYTQRDPDEVGREERNCIRLSRQFGHLMEENDFSPMYSSNHQHGA